MNQYLESDLIFNEEQHTYSLQGVGVLPGPSVVLDQMGFVSEFAKASPKSRRFGSHVHKMVQLDVNNNLDENTLSEGLLNAFLGWRKFRKDYPQLIPMLDRVEKASFHPVYLYAGTPDLPMYEQKKNYIEYYLFDIKTGVYCPSYELQTVAYEGILKHWMKLRPSIQFNRYILFLNDKAPEYRLQRLTDKTAWNAWLNTLGCYNWKKVNGYFNGKESI